MSWININVLLTLSTFCVVVTIVLFYDDFLPAKNARKNKQKTVEQQLIDILHTAPTEITITYKFNYPRLELKAIDNYTYGTIDTASIVYKIDNNTLPEHTIWHIKNFVLGLDMLRAGW